MVKAALPALAAAAGELRARRLRAIFKLFDAALQRACQSRRHAREPLLVGFVFPPDLFENGESPRLVAGIEIHGGQLELQHVVAGVVAEQRVQQARRLQRAALAPMHQRHESPRLVARAAALAGDAGDHRLALGFVAANAADRNHCPNRPG